MTEIKTPNCPKCGAAPLFHGVTPFFCTNTECDVMAWQPHLTSDELLANPTVMTNLNEDAS